MKNLKTKKARSRNSGIKKDIRKLGDYLIEVTREGLNLARKILVWKEKEETKSAQALARACECQLSQ